MSFFIQIFKNFSRYEQMIFVAAILVLISSTAFAAVNFISQNSSLKAVSGGEYIEGVLGQPSFINPVLALANGPDNDLTELIFSNISNLAESLKMSDGDKTWDVRLKENLFWDDGEKITSDDIISTIKFVQDPDSRSPQASMWQGVNIERVSEREVKLTLPEPYVFFEATLKDFRVIPKHIYGSIPAANLRLSDYNLEPIGDGPYRFLSFSKDRSGFISEYQLIRNERFSGQKPYLEKIVLKFYSSEDDLIKAFNSGAIDGFGGLNEKNISKININHQIFELRMPRYYGLFFNPDANDLLKDKNIRLTLTYATDRKKIIEQVFDGQAMAVNGPLIIGMKGYDPKVESQEDFSLDKASAVLAASDWKINSDGVAEKNINKEVKKLEFDLVVPQIPFLVETANIIKDDWSKIGVKLNLSVQPADEVNNGAVKTRNYEMIMFGNIFGNYDSPDLSSFWHSSERFYPGLNLSLYQNQAADNLIQAVRKDFNDLKRQAELSSLQSLIIADQPAIFLFSPNYIYVAENSLKGIDEKFIASASERFKNISNWYVETARVFK